MGNTVQMLLLKVQLVKRGTRIDEIEERHHLDER